MRRGTGRREANKQATRAALRQAAQRLVAEHGFEATTVAQIAEAAGVGERTFYRYFNTKDELLAERAITWIGQLGEAIRARPAAETPYQAVAGAMSAMAPELTRGQPEDQAWILGTAQPLAGMRRVEPRPLRRLEQTIAGAVLARLDAAAGLQPPTPQAEFEALLLARIAVATLRTVVVSQAQPRRPASPPGHRTRPGVLAPQPTGQQRPVIGRARQGSRQSSCSGSPRACTTGAGSCLGSSGPPCPSRVMPARRDASDIGPRRPDGPASGGVRDYTRLKVVAYLARAQMPTSP